MALSGSFHVVVDDGTVARHVVLNRSYRGLFVPPMTWRHIENFSTNAVCLVLASLQFDESDYIMDYEEFVQCVREYR